MRADGLAGLLLSTPIPENIQQKISKVQDLLLLAVRNKRAMVATAQAEALGNQATLNVQSLAAQWSPDGPPSAL